MKDHTNGIKLKKKGKQESPFSCRENARRKKVGKSSETKRQVSSFQCFPSDALFKSAPRSM